MGMNGQETAMTCLSWTVNSMLKRQFKHKNADIRNKQANWKQDSVRKKWKLIKPEKKKNLKDVTVQK